MTTKQKINIILKPIKKKAISVYPSYFAIDIGGKHKEIEYLAQTCEPSKAIEAATQLARKNNKFLATGYCL